MTQMQVINKSKHRVAIQIGTEQVAFVNKFGVTWETELDGQLDDGKQPKWKKVEFLDGQKEGMLTNFLLTVGAVRHHNGREYIYDFSAVAV